MASLSVGIAAIVVHATGFIPLLPYCDLHLWPWLPSHMLWDWELVRLYAFYILNAPLQWPKPAKWLLSTAPVLRWFRFVSVRREGEEGGVAVQSCGWTEWPLERVSWKAWEERSCLNGPFLSFFSPPGQGRDSVWLFMSVWESKRGCSETYQSSLLRGLGWDEVPVIGSVLSYTRIHARTRKRSNTIKNPLPELQGQRRGRCCEADLENEVCFTQ